MRRIRAFALGFAALALIVAGPVAAADITVDLVAEKVSMTMPNTGEVVPMWGYRLAAAPAGSATVPGPMITAAAGDNLTINLANHLDRGPGLREPTSLIIPGQLASEANAMVPTWTDGTSGSRGADLSKRVRSFTHEAAVAGSATYQWSNLNAGTFLVQSGTHPQVQVQMGLYLVLKVDDAGQPGAQIHGQAYDSEQVMLFSEVDPVLHAAVYNDGYGPGKAITSTIDYAPKYFLMNGVPYSAAGELAVTGAAGDDILVRFLNAGLQTRVPVLQGAYMTPLAEDGHELPFAASQYSLVLPAGKTFDVLIENAPAGTISLFDRRAAHSVVSQIVINTGIGVYRGGTWYLDANGNGAWDAGIDGIASFGLATDRPVVGDWDGDGVTEIGVYRDGRWFLDTNGNGAWDAGTDLEAVFGIASDRPVIGDWNGDGTSEIGVFRRGVWYLDANGNGVWDRGIDTVASFGLAGDIPVTGDWDGDGTTEIGVFRNGTWYLDSDGNGVWQEGADTRISLGLAGDIPVTGDWNGDGISQVGAFRNGTWYLDSNGNGIWDAGIDITAAFGQTGDLPVTGIWP